MILVWQFWSKTFKKARYIFESSRVLTSQIVQFAIVPTHVLRSRLRTPRRAVASQFERCCTALRHIIFPSASTFVLTISQQNVVKHVFEVRLRKSHAHSNYLCFLIDLLVLTDPDPGCSPPSGHVSSSLPLFLLAERFYSPSCGCQVRKPGCGQTTAEASRSPGFGWKGVRHSYLVRHAGLVSCFDATIPSSVFSSVVPRWFVTSRVLRQLVFLLIY